MNRIRTSPRRNWEAKVEEVGLTYHTPDGVTYWDESAYYELSAREVDVLEKAGNDLHEMCIAAAGQVLENNLFEQMGIPAAAVPAIKDSWERDDFSLYGRFDLSYDGVNPPKLLEYNADTPTALVEAAVAQWYWLEDTNRHADQFNSIHERLIAAWKKIAPTVTGKIHLGGVKDHLEDAQTVLYIEDTCAQAGLRTEQLFIEDLGYHTVNGRFVNLRGVDVNDYFKLYPWEWMWHEEFAQYLGRDICRFIEPMWKMLLSNKGLLPVLWQLYPDHPNLLPAYYTREELGKKQPSGAGYVQKPKLSREGANVTLIEGGVTVVETAGDYGEEGYIYQAIAPLADFEGNHPVMGVWIINHEAGGLGIREDTARVTGNLSRFVPHLF